MPPPLDDPSSPLSPASMLKTTPRIPTALLLGVMASCASKAPEESLVEVEPGAQQEPEAPAAEPLVEEVEEDGAIVKNFIHIPSSVGATEAEQVGVEHLLRDVKDVSIGDLSKQVRLAR